MAEPSAGDNTQFSLYILCRLLNIICRSLNLKLQVILLFNCLTTKQSSLLLRFTVQTDSIEIATRSGVRSDICDLEQLLLHLVRATLNKKLMAKLNRNLSQHF